MSLQIGWNFSKPLKNQFVQSALTARWSSVNFIESSRSLVPRGRGVYIVSVCSDVSTGVQPFCNFETPAYVGISKNLWQRFGTHTGSNDDNALWRQLFNFRNHTKFWFAEFPDFSTSDLKVIEQSLINTYGSPLNKINSVRIGKPISAATN